MASLECFKQDIVERGGAWAHVRAAIEKGDADALRNYQDALHDIANSLDDDIQRLEDKYEVWSVLQKDLSTQKSINFPYTYTLERADEIAEDETQRYKDYFGPANGQVFFARKVS